MTLYHNINKLNPKYIKYLLCLVGDIRCTCAAFDIHPNLPSGSLFSAYRFC